MKHLGQSKKHAGLEAVVNIGSGMFIAFTLSQLASYCAPEIRMYIWTGFEWNVGAGSNLFMTVVLTFVSMARSYVWRRVFNKVHVKKLTEMLEGKDYAK